MSNPQPTYRRIDPVLDLALVRQLVGVAAQHGYIVERNSSEVPPLGGGACLYAQKRICISEHFGWHDALPVLVHEVGHGILHTEPGTTVGVRATHELEANWVRTNVLNGVGLSRLLPDSKKIVGGAPSEAANAAAIEILEAMPGIVTRNLALANTRSAAPSPAYPVPVTMVHGWLTAGLLILGFSMAKTTDRGGVYGEHVPGSPYITPFDGLNADVEIAVLAHEIAHAIQHPPGSDAPPDDASYRAQAERVAHSAAAGLLQRFGYDDYTSRLASLGVTAVIATDADELRDARTIADVIQHSFRIYPL